MPPSQVHKKSVLVVEDDSSILGVLAMVLEPEGFAVFPAKTIGEALRLIRSVSPDVYLIDYILDEGDCLPVLKEIDKKGRVIIMTAALTSSAAISEKTGVDVIIKKPFTIDDILTVVNKKIL